MLQFAVFSVPKAGLKRDGIITLSIIINGSLSLTHEVHLSPKRLVVICSQSRLFELHAGW